MVRALESGRLYRITVGHAWIVKPKIAREALSMYDYQEDPTYIFVGTQAEFNSVIKRFKEDTVNRRLPHARKVA